MVARLDIADMVSRLCWGDDDDTDPPRVDVPVEDSEPAPMVWAAYDRQDERRAA